MVGFVLLLVLVCDFTYIVHGKDIVDKYDEVEIDATFTEELNLGATLAESDISVLHVLYNSTGGISWDYDGINSCNIEYDQPSGGNHWNFTMNEQGTYLENACDFIGVVCDCTSSPCLVTQFNLPCGSLSGSIPSDALI